MQEQLDRLGEVQVGQVVGLLAVNFCNLDRLTHIVFSDTVLTLYKVRLLFKALAFCQTLMSPEVLVLVGA